MKCPECGWNVEKRKPCQLCHGEFMSDDWITWLIINPGFSKLVGIYDSLRTSAKLCNHNYAKLRVQLLHG